MGKGSPLISNPLYNGLYVGDVTDKPAAEEQRSEVFDQPEIGTLAIITDKLRESSLGKKADRTIAVDCAIIGCPTIKPAQLGVFLEWLISISPDK